MRGGGEGESAADLEQAVSVDGQVEHGPAQHDRIDQLRSRGLDVLDDVGPAGGDERVSGGADETRIDLVVVGVERAVRLARRGPGDDVELASVLADERDGVALDERERV